jgi:hypothetical protein
MIQTTLPLIAALLSFQPLPPPPQEAPPRAVASMGESDVLARFSPADRALITAAAKGYHRTPDGHLWCNAAELDRARKPKSPQVQEAYELPTAPLWIHAGEPQPEPPTPHQPSLEAVLASIDAAALQKDDPKVTLITAARMVAITQQGALVQTGPDKSSRVLIRADADWLKTAPTGIGATIPAFPAKREGDALFEAPYQRDLARRAGPGPNQLNPRRITTTLPPGTGPGAAKLAMPDGNDFFWVSTGTVPTYTVAPFPKGFSRAAKDQVRTLTPAELAESLLTGELAALHLPSWKRTRAGIEWTVARKTLTPTAPAPPAFPAPNSP